MIWKDADGDFTAGLLNIRLLKTDPTYEKTGITFSDGDYIAIGCIKPLIQFTITSSSGSESTTPADIEVSLNYPIGSNATVDYTINGASTATSGEQILPCPQVQLQLQQVLPQQTYLQPL